MTTKEMIEVMQAHDKGEAIEFCERWDENGNPVAWEYTAAPSWNWQYFFYRVKPKKPQFESSDLMIWKLSEAEPLHPKSNFYQRSYIERGDKDVNNYVNFDDVLWYWEYQDEAGDWHILDRRYRREDLNMLEFRELATATPLYALGFRLPQDLKDEE